MKPTTTIKRITIPNFVQTDAKDSYLDVELDYTINEDTDGTVYLAADTVWFQGGNITDLLSEEAMIQIEIEAEALVKGS